MIFIKKQNDSQTLKNKFCLPTDESTEKKQTELTIILKTLRSYIFQEERF